MKTVKWTDYEIIATGGGEKLERWGNVILLRPDPQAIWDAPFDLSSYGGLNARYIRSRSGGGRWETLRPFPPEWRVSYGDGNMVIYQQGEYNNMRYTYSGRCYADDIPAVCI